MSKTVYAFEGLDELEEVLTRIIERDFQAEFEALIIEIATQLQGRVKDLTPAKTGNLRREWHVGNIVHKGNEYYIEVYNNVEYVEPVEYGHRRGKGFVPGKHMMEIALSQVEAGLPGYLREWLDKFLETHDI